MVRIDPGRTQAVVHLAEDHDIARLASAGSGYWGGLAPAMRPLSLAMFRVVVPLATALTPQAERVRDAITRSVVI